VRTAFTIAWRDVRSAYTRPVGYGVTAGFLAVSGVVLVTALRGGEARLDGWFAPLFVLSGVLAGLLSMRSFAEEEAAGTLEVLLTAPVRPWEAVLGKLLGVLGVFAVVIAGTLAAPVLVAAMGDPDAGPILTGYAGLALVGVAFVSAGVAVSAATRSQLVAGTASIGLLLALWFGSVVASTFSGRVRLVLEYLSPSNHVTGFLRGTVALVDVVYFVSFTALAVGAAVTIVANRR
jgi:ABC-2 type transport system permease protein